MAKAAQDRFSSCRELIAAARQPALFRSLTIIEPNATTAATSSMSTPTSATRTP